MADGLSLGPEQVPPGAAGIGSIIQGESFWQLPTEDTPGGHCHHTTKTFPSKPSTSSFPAFCL